MPVTKSCALCGAPVRRPPSQFLGKRVYCSTRCFWQSKRGPRTAEEHRCTICGVTYYARRGRPSRFCSRACQVASWRNRVTLSCQRCGKTFDRIRSEAASRFCSQSCRAYALSVGKTIAIRSAHRLTRPTPYERPGYRKLATRVRKAAGYRCENCGRRFQPGDGLLQVHHKVPIRAGGTDQPENLEALCARCHRRKDFALQAADDRRLGH